MQQRVSLISLATSKLTAAELFYSSLGWQKTFANETIVIFDLIGQSLGLYDSRAMASELGIEANNITGFSGVTLAHNVESESKVDAILDAAIVNGGKLINPAKKAFWGGYHGHFADLDGHIWEIAFNPFAPLRKNDNAFCWNGYHE